MKLSQIACVGITVGLLAAGWRIYHLFQEVKQMAVCDALSESAQEGQNSQVIEFLKKGADPNCQNGYPLKEALRGGHQDTADLLRKAGAKDLPTHQLATGLNH